MFSASLGLWFPFRLINDYFNIISLFSTFSIVKSISMMYLSIDVSLQMFIDLLKSHPLFIG